MRNTGEGQSHFNAAQCARELEIIEVAEVADAERLVLQAAKTCTERHVELIEHDLAELVCGMSGGCVESRERMAVLCRVERDDLESPCAHRAPLGFALALVTLEHLFQ